MKSLPTPASIALCCAIVCAAHSCTVEKIPDDSIVSGGKDDATARSDAIADSDWYDPGSVTTRRRDATVERAVSDRLSRNQLVDGERVEVSVKLGVALTGVVPTHAGRAAAHNSALDAGALEVVNDLVVERELAPPSE